MYHQKRVAIHFLIVIGSHIDGKPVLAHGGVNVHGHSLRGRPRLARLFAGLSVGGALLAKAAGVHKQQKGPFIACQKDFPLQFEQFGIDLGGPGMAVFGPIHGAFEMQDYPIAVFAEKLRTFGHRRSVWRTGASSAVLGAAELAFHVHPLGHDDFFGVNPFVVGASFPIEYRIYGFPFFRC